MTKWVVYADGSCPGNPGPAGWGTVVIPPGGAPIQAKGYIGIGTNQVAELTAALEGLKAVPEGVQVELVSDSQYTLKGISEWRKGWEKRGWKNSQNQTIANFDLWMALYKQVDARKVVTRWVKGHNGDTYNEICDTLAGEAVLKGA